MLRRGGAAAVQARRLFARALLGRVPLHLVEATVRVRNDANDRRRWRDRRQPRAQRPAGELFGRIASRAAVVAQPAGGLWRARLLRERGFRQRRRTLRDRSLARLL